MTAAADLTAVANGAIAWASAPLAIYNTGMGLVWPCRSGFCAFPAWYALQDSLGGSQNAATVVIYRLPPNDCLGRQAAPAIPRKAFFEFTPETLPSGPE